MKPITLLAAVALSLTTALPAMAACSDHAAPNVDWSGCDLWGADLNGANLSLATWTDGRICAAPSVEAYN